jgi:hypothetical protein
METKLKRYTSEKFWVAEQIGFKNWPKPNTQIHSKGEKSIVTIYQTWSTEAYMPYMYHSLLSQIMYTDILEKSDVYIFVDEERHEYAKFLFQHIIHEDNIIKVPKWDAVKYKVTSHPILRQYETVVVIDSDMFFYSKTKNNIYQNIEDWYKINSGILLIEDKTPADETFWSRRKYLNHVVSEEEYIDFLVDNTDLNKEEFETWLETGVWSVSPFFAYQPKTFVNEEYIKFAEICSDKEFLCDETVWLVWAKANKIPVRAVQHEIEGVSITLEFTEKNLEEYIDNLPANVISLIHPLADPNKVNPICANLLKMYQRSFRNLSKTPRKQGSLVVARSWREFGKQQFVAICELCEKLNDYDLEFHININEELDTTFLEMAMDYVDLNGHSLTIYEDQFFDQYALKKEAGVERVEKFKDWKWIYHLLLYHYLFHEKGVDYLLTYDDDILFNEKPIGELLYLLSNRTYFSCADQYADSDKCMMGEVCFQLGPKMNDEYYANTSNHFATNSGFMGLNNKMFNLFKSNEMFQSMLDLFEYKKWDHKTMTGMNYDHYRILLQEQSFLSILNRALSGRTHRVLDSADGYIISSDLEKIRQSKIEHYVSVSKYSDEYLNKLEERFEKYRESIERM